MLNDVGTTLLGYAIDVPVNTRLCTKTMSPVPFQILHTEAAIIAFSAL